MCVVVVVFKAESLEKSFEKLLENAALCVKALMSSCCCVRAISLLSLKAISFEMLKNALRVYLWNQGATGSQRSWISGKTAASE